MNGLEPAIGDCEFRVLCVAVLCTSTLALIIVSLLT